MRRFAIALMGLALVCMIGCSDEPEVQEGPLEDLPTSDEPAEQTNAPTPDEPVALLDTNVPNAKHPVAGRSAFPEPGEQITQPIKPTVLSELDQFAEPIDPANIPDIVTWQQAKQYVGHEITVEGRIVDVGQSRDGNVNFLNFHQDWRGKFYMVMFDDLAKTLDKSVTETFRGKLLRVKGMVEDHRGRPQIKILSMDQVQFVDE